MSRGNLYAGHVTVDMGYGRVDFAKIEVAVAGGNLDMPEIKVDAERGKVDMGRVNVYAGHVQPDGEHGTGVVTAPSSTV